MQHNPPIVNRYMNGGTAVQRSGRPWGNRGRSAGCEVSTDAPGVGVGQGGPAGGRPRKAISGGRKAFDHREGTVRRGGGHCSPSTCACTGTSQQSACTGRR